MLASDKGALDPVSAERDLYRKLLDLGGADDVDGFLRDALGLIVNASRARRGFIEIRDEEGESAACFWTAVGFDDADITVVRRRISSGVIAESITTGRTAVTASALDDPRWSDRESVRKNAIEAVLCSPIGELPVVGVLYLQDNLDGGPFTDADVVRAELFGRHLRPLAERLLLRRRAEGVDDPTERYRRTLAVRGLAGRSAALARVLQELVVVAPRDVTVLFTGPSGTGKTRFAKILHESGPRSGKPFVEVNCAALPETLVESELFGALAGAHSTATRKIEGKVAAAEGGTLFLDEIGELALPAQAKLLQLLQSHEYFPLGSSKAVVADVRIIAATNMDLRDAVRRRAFREDLLYRLEVMPIRIPELSARRADIGPLIETFSARACEVHRLPALAVAPSLVRAAESAEWPGNVRQLENAVEAAVLRAAGAGATRLEIAHMFPGGPSVEVDASTTLHGATRSFQEQLVRRTLGETDFNITETARRLDVTRAHVYNLIRTLGIERGDKR